jgi:hypothetical protein
MGHLYKSPAASHDVPLSDTSERERKKERKKGRMDGERK